MPRSSTKRHHNLPAHRVRLIGREQDLAAARQALLGAEGRLLTLTGTGGCGKTRLALELASNLLPNFQGGAWLVELGAVADPELVAQAIASVLGVRERSGESLIATLVRALSRRELLLVLDNFEHVVEGCAQVAEQLLDDCPRLRVLATSREALQINGEMTWRVPSLSVPDQRAATGDLLRSPAVQLFVERAQAAVPDFAVTATAAAAVGRICTRLNGLPLAIELAAARVSTLGVQQIFERLDDSIQLLVGGQRTAPTRQQSLRATLDWSYGLLSDFERAVFRRLAVFADGCGLNAAEAVCADHDVTTGDVLDLLQRLVDKSLVITDQRDRHLRYASLSRSDSTPISSWWPAANETSYAGDMLCTTWPSARRGRVTPISAPPAALPRRASLLASIRTSAARWPGRWKTRRPSSVYDSPGACCSSGRYTAR